MSNLFHCLFSSLKCDISEYYKQIVDNYMVELYDNTLGNFAGTDSIILNSSVRTFVGFLGRQLGREIIIRSHPFITLNFQIQNGFSLYSDT